MAFVVSFKKSFEPRRCTRGEHQEEPPLTQGDRDIDDVGAIRRDPASGADAYEKKLTAQVIEVRRAQARERLTPLDEGRGA